MAAMIPEAATLKVTPSARQAGRTFSPLSPRICDELRQLGRRYANRGTRLFLFGSVARSWPAAPVGADFDLGYEFVSNPAAKDSLRRELERDVEALPTIRPIDLIDFSKVSAAFRAEAMQAIVELSDESLVATTR